MMKHNRILAAVGGFFAGALNGLLGAGGGMVVVPLLDKAGLPPKKSHATSVCAILPICIFRAVLSLTSGRVSLSDASPYLLWGTLGAAAGSWILPKMNSVWLKRIFGLLMIWAAYRMLVR